MVTAIDSSVILDVLCDDPANSEPSSRALREAMQRGRLIVCECVVAEIRPALSEPQLEHFFEDWGLVFVPSSLKSAMLAGAHFERYLKRGGKGGRIIPDFIIGAHAYVHADGLLARDRGYLRDYFKGLKLFSP